MNLRKSLSLQHLPFVIYGLVFFYFSFQEPLFSPDTYDYLRASPQRSPGYVIFIKFFEFLFPKIYPTIIVVVQLLFGLVAVDLFLRFIARLLDLTTFLKLLVLGLLLFPFFPPLLIANNICSEGLSYPLYLLFVVKGIELLYNEKKSSLPILAVVYFLLVLTRGQFIVSPMIVAFAYFLKNRNSIFKKVYVTRIAIVFLLPIVAVLADKSYHKLKDGHFISTPYTFVNMSTAAFYVSKKMDVDFISRPDYKMIFNECYLHLERKNLLMTSQERAGYKTYYNHFHNNVPQICNRTIHRISRNHYFNQYLLSSNDKKSASAFAAWQSELACKSLFFTLVSHNFNDWIQLYYQNLVHGFKSLAILLFIVVIFLFSTYKILFKPRTYDYILFIFSALILSNALIISLAGHSIMRYLFYNYILMFLILIVLFKSYDHAKRP